MIKKTDIIPGVVYFIPLVPLRETPNIHFHDFPLDLVNDISAIDRVEHGVGAYSPTAKDQPDLRAWYMHPHQEDNIIVLCGQRNIELYAKCHDKVEKFEVTPHFIKHEGELIFEGPAMLGWPINVFHRVNSPGGSLSINYARQFDGFDIKDNFNIYELDTETGEYDVVREGSLDQPVQDIGE